MVPPDELKVADPPATVKPGPSLDIFSLKVHSKNSIKSLDFSDLKLVLKS